MSSNEEDGMTTMMETSAMPGEYTLTPTSTAKHVSEIPVKSMRRFLHVMRKRWEMHSPETICYTSDHVCQSMTMEQMSTQHLLMHHKKRQRNWSTARK